jgi:fatty acid synthase
MEASYQKSLQSFSRAFVASSQDEIVISGIAGRFPKCGNVSEFADNLYNKVGYLMVTLNL